MAPSRDRRVPQEGGDPAAVARRLAREALASVPGGRMPVSGETRSMAPFLSGGDRLLWERPAAPPRVGDVVIFFREVPVQAGDRLPEALRDRGLTVHRVVGTGRSGRLVTKGDGLPAADATELAEEELLGVVRAIVRSGCEFRLDGRGAVIYARLAAALSRTGAAFYGVATRIDAAFGAIVPAARGRRLARRAASWVQRLAQAGLYRMLFRPLHTARRLDVDPEGAGKGAGR